MKPASSDKPGAELIKFTQLYKQIEQSGMLSNPDIKASVTHSSSVIATLAEEMDHFINKQLSSPQTASTDPRTLQEKIAEAPSVQTIEHSANICTAGDFTDDGSTCFN